LTRKSINISLSKTKKNLTNIKIVNNYLIYFQSHFTLTQTNVKIIGKKIKKIKLY